YLTPTRSLAPLRTWLADYRSAELNSMPIALAGIVTGTLRLPPVAAASSVKAAAFGVWAQGVALARGDPSGLDRALQLLEQATAIDRESPLTHARLAEAQLLKYRQTFDSQWLNLSLASIRNAELRNPDVAVVRLVSGAINQYAGYYERAELDLLR